MLPHDRFQKLIDSNNQTVVLLGSHWIALKQIMAFITEVEDRMRQKTPPRQPSSGMDRGIIRWLNYLNGLVDDEHLIYNRWPIWVAEQLERDLTFFGRSR
jgi:hypothetical protein